VSFWIRKKKDQESSAADAVAGPAQPPVVADSVIPLAQGDLTPGALSYDSLPYFRIAIALVELPDAERRAANHAYRDQLWAAIQSAVGSIVEHARIEIFPSADSHPSIGAAYLDDFTMVPLWLDGDLTKLVHSYEMGEALQLRFSRNSSGARGMNGDPFSDPASWLLDSRPNRWLGILDAPRKQEFLAGAASPHATAAAVDPRAAASEWQAYLDLPATVQADPVGSDQLDAFRQAIGVAMPAELEAVLRISNGASNLYAEFMSCEQIIRVWQDWQAIFDEWTLDDLTGSFTSPSDEAVGIYFHPRWIPIMEERTGNYPAIDLAPGPQGHVGQIVYFGSDESHALRVVARDLTEFIKRQREFQGADDYDEERHGFVYYL